MSTYTPLQSVFLSSSQSTVSFTNIDQTYLDLVLEVTAGVTAGNPDVFVTFNGDSGSNYSRTMLAANGSSVTSSRVNSTTAADLVWLGGPNTTANVWTAKADVLSYSNTTTYKTMLVREGNASLGTSAVVNTWRGATGSSTEAIKSITITANGTSFSAGSTFSLYGVSPANARISQASGGTGIYYDSSYVYHVFSGTGVFTPNRNMTADILVVAGGGGGGANGGGGGGAGGVLSFASQSLASGTGYTCTVGAGGAGDTSGSKGGTGGNSQFGALTTANGGGGGGQLTGTGNNGGSGGGGGSSYSGGSAQAGGTGSQGNNGATSVGGITTPANLSGGGGGGAGSAGSTGTTGIGGIGGTGVNTVTNWGALAAAVAATSIGYNGYIAGGGGGGGGTSVATATAGGGNGGGGSTAATAGVATTGGGGGGGGNPSTNGGAGGSGTIIVRYAR